MPSITIDAHAKINLSLRVGDKRADGFHDVRTILQSIELADRVICEPSRGPFEIVCSTPGVPADRTNLVWTAAQRLWEAAARKDELRGVRITLDKRIPAKAGLGGGSSDAAATLVALRRLWKLPVTDQALYAIAAKLGSDVPYFLIGGTALGLGRGEDVYPLDDLPRLWVVLIFPPFGIATADAYRWLDDMREKEPILSARLSSGYLPGTRLGRTQRSIDEDGRRDGGNVGQRLDGVWRLYDRARGRSRREEAGPLGCRDTRHTVPSSAKTLNLPVTRSIV
jgi:4-diphosphocytidyl-2-C-methyl-D-erythritol kinase